MRVLWGLCQSATLVDVHCRHTRVLIFTVAATAFGATACTGGDSTSVSDESAAAVTSRTPSPVSTPPQSSSSSTPAPVSTAGPVELTRADSALKVSIEQLRGGVDRRQKARLRHAISKPIVSWIDGAFPRTGYPTNDFAKAFTAWTPHAAALAREHRDVTTNAALGADLSAVIIDKRRVRLFIFGADGVVGGASAKVSLRIAGVLPGGNETRFSVEGELYLTRDGSKWQIFGYSLQRHRDGP